MVTSNVFGPKKPARGPGAPRHMPPMRRPRAANLQIGRGRLAATGAGMRRRPGAVRSQNGGVCLPARRCALLVGAQWRGLHGGVGLGLLELRGPYRSRASPRQPSEQIHPFVSLILH